MGNASKGGAARHESSITVELFGQQPDRIRCYIWKMITGPLIAEIAAVVGEPARATMLSALLGGRALTGSALAFAARSTPQTARSPLAKLLVVGLLAVTLRVRH